MRADPDPDADLDLRQNFCCVEEEEINSSHSRIFLPKKIFFVLFFEKEKN